MRRIGTFVAACAVAGGLWGCGWESDGLARLEDLFPRDVAEAAETATDVVADEAGEAPGDTVEDAADAAPEATGDATGDGGGELAGRWAFVFEQHGTLLVYLMTISDLFVGELSADGKALELTFCKEDVLIEESPGTPSTFGQTEMPAALVSALAAGKVAIPVPGDGTFPAVQAAWTWGVQLADVFHDAMPASASDAAVRDQDGDSHPGVTVHVLSPVVGDRYMARRVIWNLGAGAPTGSPAEWFQGALTFTCLSADDPTCLCEQVPLGATNKQLETAAPIDVDAGVPSSWRMRRVSGGYGCSDLLNDWPGILTP
jgi:hypothetical protein